MFMYLLIILIFSVVFSEDKLIEFNISPTVFTLNDSCIQVVNIKMIVQIFSKLQLCKSLRVLRYNVPISDTNHSDA